MLISYKIAWVLQKWTLFLFPELTEVRAEWNLNEVFLKDAIAKIELIKLDLKLVIIHNMFIVHKN